VRDAPRELHFCVCILYMRCIGTVCCSDLMFLFDSAPSVCCGFETCVTASQFFICTCIYFLAHDDHIQNSLSREDALCVCAGSDGAGALVHARFMHISIKGDKGTHVPNLKARVPFA
jgi:hypothetical protein